MSAGKIAAAVGAVALIAAAVRAPRHRLPLAAAALALGVYASGLFDLLPNPEQAIEDVAQALGPWTYLLVGGLAFLETGAFVGLVAPGETAVIAGGVIAGQGEIDLVVLIGIVWVAAVLGDSTSFFIGRRLGRGFLLRHGERVKISRERLEQVEGYFRRHGGKTILIGRFIGLVRALAPFIAGSSRMPYGMFLPFSVLGTGLWAATFSVLGFVFWRSFHRVAEIAGRATLALAIVAGVVVGVVLAYRQLRDPQTRQRVAGWLERRPLLRPLSRHVLRPAWRLARPRLRFLRDRLTPGGLGIEFTTAVAVAVAGLYTFAFYAVLVSDAMPFTAGDRQARDLAQELHRESAVDVVEVVTVLGSGLVTGGLVVLASILLIWRRRVMELGALVGGYVLMYVSVTIAKSSIDRPRPEEPLSAFDGASYPSGHAAQATALVALAVVASRVLPNLASRAALVVGAVLVAGAVGLSRIYLRVHYWSDAVGGWALGLGMFAVCAAVALVAAHVRHNEGKHSASPSDHG